MDEEILYRHVKNALENLYDPVHLQTHPLIGLLGQERLPGHSAGESLRELLWETVQSLRPQEAMAPHRPEWLNYEVLSLHYLQALDHRTTCQELGLSEATFYRRQRQALEAVTRLLIERCPRRTEGEVALARQDTPSARQTPDERAVEEAVRMARQSRRRAVSIGDLIADVYETIEPLMDAQGVSLSVRAAPGLPDVYGDPAVLRQIVLNVLSDSIDRAASQEMELSVSQVGDETRWALDGLGDVDACDLARRSGFVVCEGLLRVYGGQLAVNRDSRRGLCVSFSLPIARPPMILIIDDDESTVELYRRYLAAEGYSVRTPADPQTWEIGSWMAEQGKPDLILLDVLMPQRDGWSVLQRVKTRPETAQIPVVVCSVLRQPRLALALGASAVLRKPITQEMLLRTVRAMLDQEDRLGRMRQEAI